MLSDQFNESCRSFSPLRDARLCSPVEKTLLDNDNEPVEGSTVGDLESEDYLACHTVVGATRGRPVIRLPWVDNQFGPFQIITIREPQLCLPSTIDVPE